MKRSRLILSVSVSATWFWLISSAAWAQEAATPDDGNRLSEVVVTAQKRSQNLQEVGTSITALDASSLAKLGLTSATDVVREVPGLQFNQFNPGMTIFNLRGVSQNDFSDHEEAPVAVYSDEAYISSMGAIAGSLYDLERVEVLRGPQGTLFGRNATGGLIHYITAKPTDMPEGSVSVTAGRFGQLDTLGVLNGPLNGRIEARLSFSTNTHEGIIQNRIGPNGESAREYAARLQFLFKLNDDARLLIKLHGVRDPNVTGPSYSWRPASVDPATGLGIPVLPNENPWGTCPGCDAGGYRNPSKDPFNQAYDHRGFFDRTLYGSTAHLDWNLPHNIQLTSVTDFQHMTKKYSEDSDASPSALMVYNTWQSFHQFSEEIRLNGQVGRLKWIGGFYFLSMNSEDWAEGIFGGAFTAFGTGGNVYDVKTNTYAAFAQAEWAVTDQLTAIAGARFTRDEKLNDYSLYAPFEDPTPVYVFNRSTFPDLAAQSYNLPSWKVELDYRFTPDIMAYASLNRGAKGGGFNEPVLPPITSPTNLLFRPEKLTSYEVGEKATFWDGKARLNADVFYYDYRDYQAFALVDGVTQVIDNYNARIKGGELELTLAPVRGLEVRMGVSALDSIIKNVVLPAGPAVDRVMPQAPKWSFNTQLRYQWQSLESSWWVEADEKTDTAMYFAAYNAPIDFEPARTVTNARIGYVSPDTKLDVTAFCNNLTDRHYRIYSSDSGGLGWDSQVYAPPRWYGITAAYHF